MPTLGRHQGSSQNACSDSSYLVPTDLEITGSPWVTLAEGPNRSNQTVKRLIHFGQVSKIPFLKTPTFGATLKRPPPRSLPSGAGSGVPTPPGFALVGSSPERRVAGWVTSWVDGGCMDSFGANSPAADWPTGQRSMFVVDAALEVVEGFCDPFHAVGPVERSSVSADIEDSLAKQVTLDVSLKELWFSA